MKVNTKRNGVRKKHDVPENITLGELISVIKNDHGLVGDFTLSQNRKDPIDNDWRKNIKDLGIVSGDLLHIIADDKSNFINELFSMKEYSSIENFQQLLIDNGCLESADYLFLFLHAAMLYLGFRTKISSSRNLFESLPEDWKSAGGFFKVPYQYRSSKDNVEVAANQSGKKFLHVNVVVISKQHSTSSEEMETDDEDDHEPKSFRLKITDYVNAKFTSYEPKCIYKDVPGLYQRFSTEFGDELIADIEERMNIKTVLLSLPDEILICILMHLTTKDIAKVTRVSKRLNRLCNEEKLWEKFLFDELKVKRRSFKEAVKSLYKARKEKKESERKHQEDRDLRVRKPQRPDFVPGNPHGRYPTDPTMGGVPGVIGGWHDMHPPDPFGQDRRISGAFPPDVLPGGSGLRGRYIPEHPFGPDNDLRRGGRRGMHPDLMRRPGFDYFD